MYTTLISVDQLQTLQASGQPFMVFDCSFELLQPAAGEAQYLQSHVAGAVRADLDRHLSAHAGDPAVCGGRHPLPTRESFAAWLGSVGFRPDMQAVVYDRQGVNYAGRLWWMLKWVGHEAVAVLDGGLQAWVAAQGALESGVCPQAVATCYMLTEAKIAWVATTEMLSQLGRPSQVVLDARAHTTLSGRGGAAGPGGWSHSRGLEPPVRTQSRGRRQIQVTPRSCGPSLKLCWPDATRPQWSTTAAAA
jgi:thiosulfate/3-mercaptopyruvate sulfurtransferase